MGRLANFINWAVVSRLLVSDHVFENVAVEKGENIMGSFTRFLGAFCLSVLFGLVAACSGSGTSTSSSSSSSDSSSSSVQLSTIDELPNSLSPVESSSSSSLSLTRGALFALAETGVPLGDDPVEAGVLDQGSSMGACTTFNMSKEAINQASMGALILCYVQNIFGASDQSVDIYDGDFHVFGLDFSGASGNEDGGGPDKVKFKIVKDDDGAITEFVMYACTDGEQQEYLSQTIDGSSFSMTEIGGNSNSYGEYNWSSSVAGTLNSNGNFTGSKTIEINFDSTWLSDGEEVGSGNGSITFVQGSDTATVSGFMTGDSTFGSSAFSYGDQFTGAMQLLDGNAEDADTYNISLLALGSGSLKGTTSGTFTCDDCEGSEDWSEDYTDSWNGDTWATEDDNDFLDDVEDAVLPDVETETVSFTGDQAYDCDGEVEQTLVIADLGVDFDAACADFQLGHEHIDCWSTISEGPEDEPEGEDDRDEGEDDRDDESLESFNISSCNGTPSGSATFGESTGSQLCSCLEGIYGVGSIPCDDFPTICGSAATVNDCVTALQNYEL